MTRSVNLKIGALFALYVLWLAVWVVIGRESQRSVLEHWDQVAAAAATGIIAFHVSRRSIRPYQGFLFMQGIAFLLLAGSWATYQQSSKQAVALTYPVQDIDGHLFDLISDSLYAACVFTLMIAWGYLALERWHRLPLSLLTTLVFAILIAGLAVTFASFYHREYSDLFGTLRGRLDTVTAALEFMVLATGLLCMLLKETQAVVWMLVGTVILMTGDMVYSITTVPRTVDALWMLGQFRLLAAIVGMSAMAIRNPGASNPSMDPVRAASARSSLSGILILVSVGAALLAPLVWVLPVEAVWKFVFSVLFIVALLLVLVRITDRFDDTVAYLRKYVRGVHESQLKSEEWRRAPCQIRGALETTGLGAYLDDFRDSAARLKQDVLFLGPERLYAAPKERTPASQASCFIVMPFGETWSADVHRILAGACEAAGVRPVRGDDLFTPTDILEDIWQSVNAADFVIADITGRNSNVLYELGIAHTLAKPVLILSKAASDIPIDLATRRIILYGQKVDAWRDELARMISAAISKVIEDYALTTRPPRAL